MSLNNSQMEQVAEIASKAGSLGEAIHTIKSRFPGLYVSSVDAFDMKDEEPAMQLGQRDLFLMQSDGHCWFVTHDAARADGIIFTQRSS